MWYKYKLRMPETQPRASDKHECPSQALEASIQRGKAQLTRPPGAEVGPGSRLRRGAVFLVCSGIG